MQRKMEADAVAKALADEWGENAVETDRVENKVYIQFADDVVVSMMIDCNLGVSHCLADLPRSASLTFVPKTSEELCVSANQFNITLARVLGVTQHFQVLDDTLKLSDTRIISGPESIVAICDTQARDNMSLMTIVVRSLQENSGEPDDSTAELPESAIRI